MTASEKQTIASMRYAKAGYADIATAIGVSVNTIKTYCRRNNLTDNDLVNQAFCMNCGRTITKGKNRPKKFCSDKCRMTWWNAHQDQVNRNAHYSFTCAHCGEAFTVYGNAHRKFCSRTCYLASHHKEAQMNNDLFMRLRAYKETVMLTRRMLKEGLITKAEFQKIESKTAKLHGFSARSIFREIT